WRGYLLPRLAPLGGGRAAILTGIVWGLWHAPIIVTKEYNYPGHPWLGALAMVLFTTVLGVVFAWLRFRSGSVWPPALAHAALNAQAGFGLLVLTPSPNSLIGAPTGLLGMAPIAALAVYLLASGRVLPETTS